MKDVLEGKRHPAKEEKSKRKVGQVTNHRDMEAEGQGQRVAAKRKSAKLKKC